MTKWLMVLGGVLCLSACATHYGRVNNGRLDLYLHHPQAQQVLLACSLDGFKHRPAQKQDGPWVVSLPYRAAFRYYYLVDGKVYLPECRMKEIDDFGSQNCIFDPDV